MILKATENDLIKDCLHRSFLFQLRNSSNHNVIHDLTTPKMEELKVHIRHEMAREFKNNKTQWKQLMKSLKFMGKRLLQAGKSETDFQSFIP